MSACFHWRSRLSRARSDCGHARANRAARQVGREREGERSLARAPERAQVVDEADVEAAEHYQHGCA
jgi:hypothetical protein